MNSVPQKKICLVGTSAVGKTSLVRRFVHGLFSDEYLTTIGVRIDKKEVKLPDGTAVQLIVWDLNGEDRFQQLSMSYLRGSAGYLLVADGTRPASIDTALDLRRRIEAQHGPLPLVLLLNKVDLSTEWTVTDDRLDELNAEATVLLTSAKTGHQVSRAFRLLTEQFL
ncbi:MAG: Rab family GTPase [Bacteroidota bacterium]